MQVTLVAHYGPKPERLAAFVHRLQDNLGRSLRGAFQPYEIDQVHATIVGLEGCRMNGGVHSKRSRLPMDLSGLVDFLRGGEFAPIRIRIGGYDAGGSYPFRSRDAHPHLRSFSIQGDVAVAIGWPMDDTSAPDSLDRLRRSFERLGVRHKWHTTGDEVDNDCFVVLGRIEQQRVETRLVHAAAESMRADLAAGSPATIEIDRDTLSFVGYLDSRLPLETSRAYRLDEPDLAITLEALYADCDRAANSS